MSIFHLPKIPCLQGAVTKDSAAHLSSGRISFRALLTPLTLPVLLLFSQPASARPGMTNTFQITQVGPREVGTDFTGAQVTSSMGCTNQNTVRVLPSAANYDAIVASLLTAFSLSLPVHA